MIFLGCFEKYFGSAKVKSLPGKGQNVLNKNDEWSIFAPL
jgi:hypothetical protein